MIVPIPPNCDFTLQNIPFGVISTEADKSPRPATAIGEYAVDLRELAVAGLFDTIAELRSPVAKDVFSKANLNSFMAMGRPVWRAVREVLQKLFSDVTTENPLTSNPELESKVLIPLNSVTLHMPVEIGDYTDFYASKEHATNVGTMFRGEANALMPNWVHIPVGYHGRSSSIVVSSTPIRRPKGLVLDPQTKAPVYSACKKLDFELEVAFLVGTGNKLGDPIPFDSTEEHIFGMVLMNDWSARDIQQFEYVPLGPFLGKNFGTTISPWIVTMDALEPFRVAQPEQCPIPAAYLRSVNSEVELKDAYDVKLDVFMKTKEAKEENHIATSNLKYMYWTFKQQLAHHTVNGCNSRTGDLLGSGTISGIDKGSYGSLLELSWNGTRPLNLDNGVSRTFICDGDEIVMRGSCEKEGVRIGFGECRGVILPAHE